MTHVAGSILERRMTVGVKNGRLLRPMAFVALEAVDLPTFHLEVLLPELLIALIMALQAKVGGRRAQESRIAAAVRLMADQAVILARRVNRDRSIGPLHIRMTGQADLRRTGSEQRGALGAVSVMALRAVAIGNGRVRVGPAG
jgi:hypothetical protein